MQMMPASPEFRRQVEAFYHRALKIDPIERSSFLDQTCGVNSSLREEVESLLSAHDLKTARPESAPSEVATEILGRKPTTLIGQSIAHYKILSLLGRGGMGEVYLAYDTKLGRNVALKLLPKSLQADEERLRRFEREARSASVLNHPNICVIHEIGETENGRHFITMEHIEGMTLRQRLKQGPIAINDAVDISRQVATALIAAHKAGVVHRDIKPENIMLRPDGFVKVLDFGLAKLTEKYAFPSDSEAATFPAFDTHSENLIGTVFYLSPEQAKRQPIDERTDIWSLGVVLYEMLVGRLPFSGETPSHAIVAILESEPESLTKSLDLVPSSLDGIVRKALQKDRRRRYRNVVELAEDLETVKQELSIGSFEVAKPPRRKVNSRFVMSAVGAALLVVTVAGVIYLLTRNRKPEAVSASIGSIAVLPFDNPGGDPELEYLSDGMTESLINSLSQLPNLKVTGRSSAFHYKGVKSDTQQVGSELSVQAIMTGRIIEHDGILTIAVDLEDVSDKHQIWGETYNRRSSDLLVIQDELSHKITEKLRLKMTGAEEQRFAKRPTQNVDAYQLYLKGRWYWNKFTKEGRDQAINSFEQAIKLDPNYALAYSGLAEMYVVDGTVPLRESSQKAKQAAETALALDSSLGEAHATLGFIKTHYETDWMAAEAEFKRAIELNPNYATAHHFYADMLMARGNFDRALQELEKARDLDPLSPIINVDFGLVYFYQRDYDRSIEYLKQIAERFPDFFPAREHLGWAYTQKKMYKEAIAEYQKANLLSRGSNTMVNATLAYTYAVSGKKDEARKILRDLESRSTSQHIPPLRFALVNLALGQKNQVFQWLERARTELDLFLVYIRISPFFDSLRNDPKFQDFIQSVGLA
jgi:eukaryotic-like serine/threonine-protein kinase